MNLVIVESPAKAKTINKYLGKDYLVLASYGHIRDLPSKNGSVDPENKYQMEREIDYYSKKYLKNYYEILDNLRKNNINSEIFLDSKRNLGKQLTYANKRECPVAVICGENEFKDNKITIKNTSSVKKITIINTMYKYNKNT